MPPAHSRAMDFDDDGRRGGASPTPAGAPDAQRHAGRTGSRGQERHGGPSGLGPGRNAVPSIRTAVIHDDRVVVHVAGALDLYTVGVLREVLLDSIAADFTDIVVVLTGVTFVDSTGLGVLVGAHKRVRSRGGRLQLVVDQESVLKVIRITALNHVFALYPTLDAALAG